MSVVWSMVAGVIDDRRGILYPQRMPRFQRLAPPPDAADLIAWLWIPEWDLEPGEVLRQEVVAYPALNLVVEPSGVQLVGATTAVSYRELAGRGWAVGALLRPAGVAAVAAQPDQLRDAAVDLHAPELRDAVAQVMDGVGDDRASLAAQIVSRWLVERAGDVSEAAQQANAMSELLMTDAEVRTTEQAAARLAVSQRTLQRMTHRYVGVPPLAMIRRRRLQEAAQRLRDDPSVDLAELAAELGYADHAHLTRDFRLVLGLAPSAYRRDF